MITILSGDQYLIRRSKQEMVDEFIAENGELDFHDIDLGQNPLAIKDLLSLLRATSIFSSRKLIVLHNLSTCLQICEEIETVFRYADEIELIIIEPFLASPEIALLLPKKSYNDFSPSLRNQSGCLDMSSFLKLHPGFAKLHAFLPRQEGFKNLKALKGSQLVDWLCQRAQAYKSELSPAEADYLISRVGEEMQILNNEVKKLSGHPIIDKQLIDQLTHPLAISQVFDLVESLLKGELKKALIFYRQHIQQQKNIISVLSALTYQLQILAVVKNTLTDSESDVAAEYQIHAYSLRKARASVKKISLQKLNNLIELTRRIDRYVRVEFANPKEALLLLITRGCHISKE